jgi:L-threonylcarbamoyladenylate synthase
VTTVFEVEPSSPDRQALTAAAEALNAGGLVVFPTETVYGIAARPDITSATMRLFEAKHRPPSLNLPVLAATESQAWDVAERSTAAGRLATAFWPGGITLVLKRTARSREWWLGDRQDTVAVRVPDHPVALRLLRSTGVLAVTSANVSGQAPASDREGLLAAFSDRAEVILVPSADAPHPGGVASTVIDCTGEGISILRAGAISEEEIRRVAEGGPSGSR